MVNSSTKPNVVFILTDDQGYGDLGCTGNKIIETPNIDKLYDESVRFSNFHVGPTCAPTRAGLMTGHYHNSTGVWHTIGGRSLLRKDEVTLAAVLRNNGYKTGIFGKWHLGDNYPYRPHDRGFDEAVVHGGGGIGQTPDFWGNDYFNDTYFKNGVSVKYEGYCTDVFFNLGMDFIEKNLENPFFCFISANAPHRPLRVEDKYADKYRKLVPEQMARFYGMIENIDENLGNLRKRLVELGISDNTIFIFMTDNGTADGCKLDQNEYLIEGYNAGMRGKKGSPYEGGHKVPFFLHYPAAAINKGTNIEELTANIDFMPTIIDICDLKNTDNLKFDGVSLVPAIGAKAKYLNKRTIVTDSQRIPKPKKWKDSCVMNGRWRLIRGKELYDISIDPEQRTNIAKQFPEVVLELRKEYEGWWKKVSARFNEDIPIILGTQHEKVTDITSHDWRGDVQDCAWHQNDIRWGKICNSYVEVEFFAEGEYLFELRRWPIEIGNRLTEGLPGILVRDHESEMSGGRAIPLKKAKIRVGNFEEVKQISETDEKVAFRAYMTKGKKHLQTFFEDADGNTIGAYYVYVVKLPDN